MTFMAETTTTVRVRPTSAEARASAAAAIAEPHAGGDRAGHGAGTGRLARAMNTREPDLLGVIERACANLARRPPRLPSPPPRPQRRRRTIVATLVTLIVVALPTAGAALAVTTRGTGASGCAPLRYWFDPNSGPPGLAGDVDAAFAALSAATGMEVVASGPPWSDTTEGGVVVRFAPLADRDRGPQLGETRGGTTGAGPLTADILLNAYASLPTGTSERTSWRRVMLHELGHVLGLGHSSSTADVMYPDIDSGPTGWSPADLERLRDASARLGCHPPAETDAGPRSLGAPVSTPTDRVEVLSVDALRGDGSAS